MSRLEVSSVSFTYSKGTPFEKKAIDNISVEFPEGKMIGLIGQTGCGKSTLVQMLNGLIKPDSGKVFLDGQDIWENPKKIRDIRFRVGLVFQYPEYQLFEETVYKDISYGPKNIGLNEEDIKKRVAKAIGFCNVDPSLLEVSPFELSGGQKRRIAIAGIMAMEPDILILDEPAAGLDPRGRNSILGGLREYQKKTGKTVVIVSHSMEDVAKYTDYTIVMSKASIVTSCDTSEVFRDCEKLKEIGLNIPQITELMIYLKQSGVDVDDGIYTVEKAIEEIARHLKKS